LNTSEKGQSFERAVETALVAFYDSSSLKDFVTIEHNVIEVGRSGQGHQIDIRLQIQAGIVELKLLCECKCYEGRVPLTDVLALKSRVDDCHAAGGVLITNKGFQKGANVFAKQNGITLLTLKGQHIVSWGAGARARNCRMVWEVVSNLAAIWPHALPPGVELSLLKHSLSWRERVLSLFSDWVDAVEFKWNGISIQFQSGDFSLDGAPVEFSGQPQTCFADEQGFTIPSATIKKVLVWRAMMDRASHAMAGR
jgi:hypothetical protein